MADNGDPGGQELDGFQTLMESSMTSQRHDPDADFFEDDVSNLALTDIENNYLRNRETTEPRPNTDNINNSRVNPSQNRLPDNATLRSETSNSVILIKPLGPDVEKLINNPIALVEAVKKSPYSHIKEKDVRVNKRKKIIAIELKSDRGKIEELLKVKVLGKWPVECYKPNKSIMKYGVIFPIDVSASLEELKDLISLPGNAGEIQSLGRLKKRVGNQVVDSSSVKVGISGEFLPGHLTIGCSYYKLRPFVEEPIQCYRCQRLGHTSHGCTSKERCLLCGLNHNKTNCTSEHHKCANCGQAHRANSSECKIMKEAREIEKLKAERGMSHDEARRMILQTSQLPAFSTQMNSFPQLGSFSRNREQVPDTHAPTTQTNSIVTQNLSRPRNYSEALQNSQHTELSEQNIRSSPEWGNFAVPKEHREMSTQTDVEITGISTQTENLDKIEQKIRKSFVKTLEDCFLELFKTNIVVESTAVKQLMIKNAISKSFGTRDSNSEKEPQAIITSESQAITKEPLPLEKPLGNDTNNSECENLNDIISNDEDNRDSGDFLERRSRSKRRNTKKHSRSSSRGSAARLEIRKSKRGKPDKQ